ncbi:MAG: CHAD domain-containing protein [Armatimonadetes bacterium]|nr:CHAD domain-containing protein [Armatimonadota bacterium]
MISTDGFLIAGTHPRPVSGGHTAPRKFLLEGTTDVFQVMPKTHRYGEAGPIPPSLGSRLLPALDALEQTVKQLGKHPTPEEADRSNVRRLIRVLLTLAETHRDSYPEKKFERAARKLKQLASAVGRFKDHGILEQEVASLFPGGEVPRKVRKRLDRSSDKVKSQFDKAFREFRKEDLDSVVRVLSRPAPVEAAGPQEIQKEDRRRLSQRISDLTESVDRVGLHNQDPLEFHASRKALRWLLLTTQSSDGLFGFPPRDVEGMSRVVNGLGVAQDKFIAWDWLEREGFDELAAVKKGQYGELHDHELQGSAEFERSGALQRIRQAVA